MVERGRNPLTNLLILMIAYQFTIYGNHEDPEGNPLGYTRTTQGARFNARYRRYVEWKQYVVAAFLRGAVCMPKTNQLNRHPIGGMPKARVTISISFKSEVHSDPDNIVKGIIDSLFENDKHVDVSTKHFCGQPRGEVNVVVALEQDELAQPSQEKLPARRRATRVRPSVAPRGLPGEV